MDVIRELVGVKGWLGNVWVRKRISSRGMYIRSTSDILPKWKDIRSIADIPKLGKIEKGSKHFYNRLVAK